MIETKHLNAALATVGPSVAGRSTLPVLSNVLLSGANGRLAVQSNNLETGITTSVPYNGPDFDTTVPYGMLSAYIKLASAGSIELDFEPGAAKLNVKVGGSRSTFLCIDADEFPNAGAEATKVASFPADKLARALGAAILAAAEQHTNPILQGVCFHIKGDDCTLAAIDGFCLSVQHVDVIGQSSDLQSYVFPATAMRSLIKLLAGAGESDVALEVTENKGQGVFVFDQPHGPVRFVSRIIEGTFPDYERFVPRASEESTYVDCSREEFSAALRRIALIAKTGGNIATMRILTEQGAITLESKSAEVGSTEERIDARIQQETEQAGAGAYNVKYLNEALGTTKSERLMLFFNGPQSPLVVREAGDERQFFLVMPMRIP